jgi:glycosyltransferase involved in cell wall biosynthesis
VVFPYIEASQSGTIPICIELGIPVLVTPVGGLAEQVLQSLNGTVCEDLSPSSLSKHIEEILDSTSIFTDKLLLKGHIKRQLIMDCINA